MTLDPNPSTATNASYQHTPTGNITAGGVDFAYQALPSGVSFVTALDDGDHIVAP